MEGYTCAMTVLYNGFWILLNVVIRKSELKLKLNCAFSIVAPCSSQGSLATTRYYHGFWILLNVVIRKSELKLKFELRFQHSCSL